MPGCSRVACISAFATPSKTETHHFGTTNAGAKAPAFLLWAFGEPRFALAGPLSGSRLALQAQGPHGGPPVLSLSLSPTDLAKPPAAPCPPSGRPRTAAAWKMRLGQYGAVSRAPSPDPCALTLAVADGAGAAVQPANRPAVRPPTFAACVTGRCRPCRFRPRLSRAQQKAPAA